MAVPESDPSARAREDGGLTASSANTPGGLDMDRSAARELARKNGVVLVDYDAAWPRLYEEAAARIRSACNDLVVAIEHVGSTSIPGIRAKPYLDIMPGFATFEDGFKAIPAMESLGYESRGEYGIPGRHYFSKWVEGDDSVWKHNVHAYEVGHAEWVRHIVFRDALRAKPALRDEYEALELDLAVRFSDDVNPYADGKTGFVERVIRKFGGPERPAQETPS